MPTTPLDLAHQKRLRELVSTILPEVEAQHIAEAIAAGYGSRSHAALLADIRVAEAGGDVAVPEFDYEASLARLRELGESLDHRRAETLRPALTVAAEGPLSGIAADPRPTDEKAAARLLRAGLALLDAGDSEDAAPLLSEACHRRNHGQRRPGLS